MMADAPTMRPGMIGRPQEHHPLLLAHSRAPVITDPFPYTDPAKGSSLNLLELIQGKLWVFIPAGRMPACSCTLTETKKVR